jgi:cyclic pyranopterin phosphate synthase
MKKLTHLDARGEARMMDVSAKPPCLREAVARGEIRLRRETLRLIQASRIAKGNVLAAARLAGILAAKQTGALIPLCHPLPLTHCAVDALTAVVVAALTIYDMCKAADRRMRITGVRLVSKSKGASST